MLEVKQRIHKLLPDLLKLEFGCEIEFIKKPYLGNNFKGKMIITNYEIFNSIKSFLVSGVDSFGNYEHGLEYELEITKIIGKKIGIAEILRALIKTQNKYIEEHEEEEGTFSHFEVDKLELILKWNLEKDNLDDQSEETKKWVDSVIK